MIPVHIKALNSNPSWSLPVSWAPCTLHSSLPAAPQGQSLPVSAAPGPSIIALESQQSCRKGNKSSINTESQKASKGVIELGFLLFSLSNQLELSRAHMPCICCIASNVDDLYQVKYVHEQKAHGLQWTWLMGVATMANRRTIFVKLVGYVERFKAHLCQFFTKGVWRVQYESPWCLRRHIQFTDPSSIDTFMFPLAIDGQGDTCILTFFQLILSLGCRPWLAAVASPSPPGGFPCPSPSTHLGVQ